MIVIRALGVLGALGLDRMDNGIIRERIAYLIWYRSKLADRHNNTISTT